MARRHTRPEQEGDVLGISHARAPIPRATADRGGHPAGIEVPRRHAPEDDPPTTTDVGAGGDGTTVKKRD